MGPIGRQKIRRPHLRVAAAPSTAALQPHPPLEQLQLRLCCAGKLHTSTAEINPVDSTGTTAATTEPTGTSTATCCALLVCLHACVTSSSVGMPLQYSQAVPFGTDVLQ